MREKSINYFREMEKRKIITRDFLFGPFSFVVRLLDVLVVEELVPPF